MFMLLPAMRTKRAAKPASEANAQEPLNTALPEPRIESEGAGQLEPEAPKGSERKTVSWYVDSAGVIQWDRVRDATKDQLRDLFKSPTTLEKLGLNPEEPAAPVEFFDPEWCDELYDTLGKIEAFGAVRFWKVNPEIASKVFTYTEKEKDKLRGPTSRVVNKYVAEWMIRFKDEIALALLLFAMTANKIAMLNGVLQIQAAMDKQAAERAKVQAQAPQPVQAQPEPVAAPANGDAAAAA